MQEWLNIWQAYDAQFNSSLETSKKPFGIDGIFGPKTEATVKKFQNFLGISETGIVDKKIWQHLVAPMCHAFQLEDYDDDLSGCMRLYALQYEMWRPYEVQPNRGPWVRSFMDGHEGEEWAWGEGFVQTVMDSAFSQFGKKYTDYFKKTYAVETMRENARKKNLLVTNDELKRGVYRPNQGDVVVYVFPSDRKAHQAGIITDHRASTLFVIVGNTNFAGSRTGVGVFRLKWNYENMPLEVIKMGNIL